LWSFLTVWPRNVKFPSVRLRLRFEDSDDSRKIRSGTRSDRKGEIPMAIKKRKFKSDTLQWTYDRYVANDPKLVEEYEQEVLACDFPPKVYEVWTN